MVDSTRHGTGTTRVGYFYRMLRVAGKRGQEPGSWVGTVECGIMETIVIREEMRRTTFIPRLGRYATKSRRRPHEAKENQSRGDIWVKSQMGSYAAL